MRTLVIGDIHGGLRALQQVLSLSNVSSEDLLIFLGDYVDGWSETAPLIDFLIELKKTNECVFIIGNHDEWCKKWLLNNKTDETWLFHGGISTIKSYDGFSEEKKLQHLNFFERMINYHIDEANNLFIHAGFTSMHGPEQEVHISNYSWDRTLWEMAASMDKNLEKDHPFYPKRLSRFNEIYIGHTPTLKLNCTRPMHMANVWNMDTGAAFTGSLSIMDINTKQIWQSDRLVDLYPGENGRNK